MPPLSLEELPEKAIVICGHADRVPTDTAEPSFLWSATSTFRCLAPIFKPQSQAISLRSRERFIGSELGDKRRRLLDRSWAAVFREHLLNHLPVAELAAHFSRELGRPTKDLHAVVGVLKKREKSLQETIHNLGPYASILINVIGTGPWFDAYVPNLVGLATGEFVPGKRGQ